MSEEVTQDFLIARTLDVFRESGLSSISFRSVAERANVPATTLQYRFESKAELLQQAFSAVIDGEIERLQGISSLIGSATFAPEDLANTFRSIVDPTGSDGPDSHQYVAFEILVASFREKELRPHARKWIKCLHDFWATIGRSGNRDDDFGWFLTELHIGLLMHSTGVGHPFETAATNSEIIDRAILGRSERNPVWYQACLKETLAARDASPSTTSRGKVVERLLSAGAEIIAREGPTKLTYRLLAARANTARSAILYHFPTQHDLLYGLLQHTMREAVLRAARRKYRQMESFEAFVDEIAAHYLEPWFGDVPMVVVIAEIHELAAHDRNLEDIAWYSRMAQGVTAYRLVDPGLGTFSITPFDSHASTTWTAGCALTHMALQDRKKARPTIAARVAYGLNVFKGLWPLQWPEEMEQHTRSAAKSDARVSPPRQRIATS